MLTAITDTGIKRFAENRIAEDTFSSGDNVILADHRIMT